MIASAKTHIVAVNGVIGGTSKIKKQTTKLAQPKTESKFDIEFIQLSNVAFLP